MTNEPNPQQALAEIAAARAEVGRTLNYPVAWDFLYGGIVAVISEPTAIAAQVKPLE